MKYSDPEIIKKVISTFALTYYFVQVFRSQLKEEEPRWNLVNSRKSGYGSELRNIKPVRIHRIEF